MSKKKNNSRNNRVVQDNPAKSMYGVQKNGGKNKHKQSNFSRVFGLTLAGIQLVMTIIFMLSLFVLNMLPMKYLVAIGLVFVIIWLLIFLSQFLSKKKGITGKIISVLMSIVLVFGSFYIFKTNGTVQEISGGGKKIDRMVVAVLKEDQAETIEDAVNYTFGVQYSMRGEDVKSTVSAINEELGMDITTNEYGNLREQAKALHENEVQAIIYNEAYMGVLEDEFSDFENSVKIIYSHDIETKVENKAEKVEVKNDTFTVYISGIDVYGAIETNSRSDVNIMAVVNPTSHQILLVTTPRDYYVEIPGISGGEKDKLTHAGIYGVDASMATLSALYGIDMDFYARVNFTSLITMIDALGGVDVYSDQAFDTVAGTTVNAGMNHFNGEQALAFSRERYNVAGGDFQRGKNQQAVITAMIKKAVSPAILMGANGILESISGNVDTNMSSEQIQTLIKSQLSTSASWSIKSMAAEGTGDQQYCYSSPGMLLYVTQPDMVSIEEIRNAIEAVKDGAVFQDSEVAE